MNEHAVVQLRVEYALDPEDPSQIGGYKVEWRRPFGDHWEMIATEAFAWMHLADFQKAHRDIIMDAVWHLPQVLPFE